jgi:hypothetical protein
MMNGSDYLPWLHAEFYQAQVASLDSHAIICQKFQGKQLYSVKSWHLCNFISSIETTVKT